MGARRQRIPAVAALGVLLAPWCAMAASVAHLVVDPHHGETPHMAADLQASLHGHRHLAGTPEHDHLLVRATPSAVASRPLTLVLIGASIDLQSAPIVFSTTSNRRAVSGVGLGPPGPDRLPTVLRI